MEHVTIARSGDPLDGAAWATPCYRIPALTVTATGRVILAWDVRADWRDLPGDFDLAYRTSDDNGRTWAPVQYLRHHGEGRGFGDASLTSDPATGRVLCWYVASTGRSYFTADAADGLELWLATSDDEGKSWSHRQVTDLKPDWAGGMFAASGNGIALQNGPLAGTLLQTFVVRDPQRGTDYAAVAASADGGLTWQLGTPVGPGCDESKVVEDGDGVLLHARATPRRRSARSVDAGGTFAAPVADPALVDPGCNGGLTRWQGRLVCSLLDDEHERRRLVLRVATDSGAWQDAIDIDTGAAGYSVLAELADGALGLAYEFGDYAGIRFCRIEPAEVGLEGAPATLVPLTGGPGAARPPVAAP